jgi:hypothetical protein
MNKPELFSESNQATYCPESNKLHLYVGRVPRPEYDALRAEGWTSTPKQSEAGQGEFAATWTPERRDTALSYAGHIGDEDASPAERAADRAERFGGYRDKRLGEATGHADRYDAGPTAHGYQSQARAERSAARHDRVAGRACDAWSKADYWTSRTAGVINHALYKSRPDVRMGRIKVLEAELRKMEKSNAEHAAEFETWRKISTMTDPEQQTALAERFAGLGYGYQHFKHPRTEKEGSLWDFLRSDAADRVTGAEAAALYMAKHRDPLKPEFQETSIAEWINHYKLRLAYENQMLEAQGGRAAFVEMEVGGFIGSHQIRKVNKSPATGRVVSVQVAAPTSANFDRRGKPYGADNPRPLTLHTLEVERMGADVYRAPTDEERKAFADMIKGEKAREKKARSAVAVSLINPTDEDAEKLQALWNERARVQYFEANPHYKNHPEYFQPSTVRRITQATYSANSKGTYAKAETEKLGRDGYQFSTSYNGDEFNARLGGALCKIRTTWGDGNTTNKADSVIVITDKPQAALPAGVWDSFPLIECEHCKTVTPSIRWKVSHEAKEVFPRMYCPKCRRDMSEDRYCATQLPKKAKQAELITA